MPIYQYKCKQHGDFERYCKVMNVTPTYSCPSCGIPATMVFSAFSFRMDIPVTFIGPKGQVLDKKTGGINAPIGRPQQESNLAWSC